jgi:RNA polymerase sigma-70 factor (ECF subfamily)
MVSNPNLVIWLSNEARRNGRTPFMSLPTTHHSLLRLFHDSERQREAWAVFEAKYGETISGWCRRRGLRDEAIEDVTQDILLKLFLELSRGSYDPLRGRFRSWLKAVVNNALSDHWRREKTRLEESGVGGSAFLEQLANLSSPEEIEELTSVIENQTAELHALAIARVRAKVKESTWQAFEQHLLENRAAADVAAELGLSVATIYKSTYRVKQMLIEEIRNAQPVNERSTNLPGSNDTSKVPE